MRIGLFIPCYVDMLFPEVGIATLELLERLGFEVGYPLGQTCCGQPMSNAIYRDKPKICAQVHKSGMVSRLRRGA